MYQFVGAKRVGSGHYPGEWLAPVAQVLPHVHLDSAAAEGWRRRVGRDGGARGRMGETGWYVWHR